MLKLNKTFALSTESYSIDDIVEGQTVAMYNHIEFIAASETVKVLKTVFHDGTVYYPNWQNNTMDATRLNNLAKRLGFSSVRLMIGFFRAEKIHTFYLLVFQKEDNKVQLPY